MGSYTGYLVETFFTLVVVCAIAFAVLWGAKRLGVGRASGSIRLVGQLPLDARRAIYLVSIGESVIVVGASEGGLTKLGEMPADGRPAGARAQAPMRFADVLARVTQRPTAKPKDARRCMTSVTTICSAARSSSSSRSRSSRSCRSCS